MDHPMTAGGKCKCPLCKTDEEHWKADSDARTLQDAGEIRGNPSRHKAAMSHMKKKHSDLMTAVEMEKKVTKGLKSAFPEKE